MPPVVPPDIVQVSGSLGHHWGPNSGLPWGTELEHMLGSLGYLQGRYLLATLELPMLHGITPQY
jgi:hypothetical protein